ncbi:MAG: hypothetical protein FJ028_02755 [Chloroflexi bacterium]|nr:hypothetical protein [Chloroflexota bacterium]
MRDPNADALSRFWIGRNHSTSTRLPYLLRLPVAREGRIFLAARESWPRSTDVYCHQLPEWPPEAEVLEEVPVEACWRAGAAVHLVLRRPRLRRSIFVWTKKAGRTLVFWRSEATMRRARPGIRVPLARAFEGPLTVAVDDGERYPWRFAGHGATTERRSLPAGDYALVREGVVAAAVERKTAGDLARSAIAGRLGLELADLEQVAHAALVVEGRYSDALKAGERGGVRTGWLPNVLAALQAAHPRVTWMFAETRQLAEDWAYRWLAACARADAEPYALPLLDERAIGEPAMAEEAPRPLMLDAAARRESLLREALGGTIWTSRDAADRLGVTQATVAGDLAALVRKGQLRMLGRGRARRYVRP